MKTVSALLLEPSDFTKDGNLKIDAFNAICTSDLVLHGTSIIKHRDAAAAPPTVAAIEPIVINEAPRPTRTRQRLSTRDIAPQVVIPDINEESEGPDWNEGETMTDALPDHLSITQEASDDDHVH